MHGSKHKWPTIARWISCVHAWYYRIIIRRWSANKNQLKSFKPHHFFPELHLYCNRGSRHIDNCAQWLNILVFSFKCQVFSEFIVLIPQSVGGNSHDAFGALLWGKARRILQGLVRQRGQMEARLVWVAEPGATRHGQHLAVRRDTKVSGFRAPKISISPRAAPKK